MMMMAEMVKKMLNQKMPKMLLNQPLRTIAMVLVLALVLAPLHRRRKRPDMM